jgi:hypothetical protein
MRRHPYPTAPADESAALLTAALVLTLFGGLSVIEATGWVIASALFILAAIFGIGALIRRYAKRN